jgi:hypothetical protein
MLACKLFSAVHRQARARDDSDFVMASPIEGPGEGPPLSPPPFVVEWALAEGAGPEAGASFFPADREVGD